jgi:hypothetical protein
MKNFLYKYAKSDFSIYLTDNPLPLPLPGYISHAGISEPVMKITEI